MEFKEALTAPGIMLQSRRYRAVLQLLDRFPAGLCLIQKDGRVPVKNREATRLLNAADKIELNKSNQLQINDPALNEQLYDHIQAIYADKNNLKNDPAQILIADKKDEQNGLLVEVSSLPPEPSPSDNSHFVLITLIDMDTPQMVSVSRVSALYSLTHAETSVYHLLVNGYSTREIADTRNVQVETVISQVKSILHKTGSRERLDLLRLLISTASF
ncbi:MAG: LuxR C-terminal-related transcriptional regulator [Pseudomonadota bacterium]